MALQSSIHCEQYPSILYECHIPGHIPHPTPSGSKARTAAEKFLFRSSASSSYCTPLSSDLHFQFPDSTFNLIRNPYPITHAFSSLPRFLHYCLLCYSVLCRNIIRKGNALKLFKTLSLSFSFLYTQGLRSGQIYRTCMTCMTLLH